MKINKITSIICLVLTLVFGVATVILQYENAIIAGIASNIFTGFIVSIVVALIGYYYEKNRLKDKLKDNVKSLYINMVALKDVTGNILVQIAKTTNLRDLPFNNITSLAGLNIEFSNRMELVSYDGFCHNAKTTRIYIAFINYSNKLYNLKNIATQIMIDSLKHDNLLLSYINRQKQGFTINPQETEIIESLKNTINIRTAKLHEYEASLIIELDDLASQFYMIGNKKTNWNDIKLKLQNEAADILST